MRLVLGLAAGVLAACASQPWHGLDVQPMRIGGGPAAEAVAWAGHVTAVGRNLPSLPNGMLQLPAVSPDGRRIAFLELADPQSPPSMDAAITGRGLAGVNLKLRTLDAQGDGDLLAERACWPAWSPDGGQLLFVSYDEQDRCFLGVHDVGTGVTRRHAVGLRRMMMPRLSPDGRTVAVVAWGQVPDQATLFLVDLETSRASPGPATDAGAQLLPRWVDRDALLFVELDADGGRLVGWRRGRPGTTTLARLDAPASVFDAQHMLTGIAQPLRPGGAAFAVQDLSAGRITLVDLASGAKRALEPGTIAGAWWGGDWFVAAGPQQIELLAIPAALPAADAAPLPSLRLFDGRWAPLHTDRQTQSLILVGEADDPTRFNLVQLWLVVEAGR